MRKYAVISCALLFTGALSSVAAKSVQFRFTDTIARSVSVIGSFNQFDPAANPMHRGAYGAWTSSISLPTGTHTYAFLVDGEYRVRDRYAPNHEVAADHQIASVILIASDTNSFMPSVRTAPAALVPEAATVPEIHEDRSASATKPRTAYTGTRMTDALLQQTKDQVTILNAAGEDEGMASELVRQYFLIVLNDLATFRSWTRRWRLPLTVRSVRMGGSRFLKNPSMEKRARVFESHRTSHYPPHGTRATRHDQPSGSSPPVHGFSM
jgi:hypothetical protein